MKRLIAKYEIQLTNPILIKWSLNETIKFRIQIDNADVTITIIPTLDNRSKYSTERLWTYEAEKIKIEVCLPESETPPPADITPTDGKGSYYEIEEYFNKRLPIFTDIAKKVYFRFIRYFKYKRGIPSLDEGHLSSRFTLPTWVDENGKEIWKSESRAIYANYTYGVWYPEFGIKKFTKRNKQNFINSLKSDMDVELYQEILSDAKSAIIAGNLRRGILEMAIACEIAVKQTFFNESTISGLAFEYIENQRRIRVIDLISKVAIYTSSASFKQINKDAFIDIDHLFRCRNRIVHRGDLSYLDDKNEKNEPNKKMIKKWWASLEELFVWIKTLR